MSAGLIFVMLFHHGLMFYNFLECCVFMMCYVLLFNLFSELTVCFVDILGFLQFGFLVKVVVYRFFASPEKIPRVRPLRARPPASRPPPARRPTADRGRPTGPPPVTPKEDFWGSLGFFLIV